MKLAQVMLFVKNVSRMRAFYCDALGLAIADASRPDFIVLDSGGARLALHLLPAQIAEQITITDPPQRRADTAIKYTFHTDDVAAARNRIVEHGGHMGDPWEFGGRTLCDGLDPEGNVFQIANG